ncbi:MAG: type II toxin-antitoxin system RelE/ParE family toxin [Acidobacteria bacterium]|nr:type II toxin-antitoxin system RelE/ParE family toxin [Acidobacteriota bacterium]
MSAELKRLPAHFYRLPGGPEPVREWLKTFAPEDRRIIGEDIKDVEFAWPIGLPLVRSLGHGLWEVRSALRDGRAARVIFAVEHQRMVLLHGFVKKTQATPKADLDLARKRRRPLV